MMQNHKDLVYTFFDTVLNAGRLELAQEYIAPEYVQHNPMVPQGLQGFVDGLSAWRVSFPDYHSTIKDVIAEGDRVWVWHTARGTQQGAFGELPASGRTFELDVRDIFRVENGKFAEHWDLFNVPALMQQLHVS
jgi:steroid delta-isomerase-like uncharacterized protein